MYGIVLMNGIGILDAVEYLRLFWPYTIFMIAALILLQGAQAADIRNCIVLFTGSVVLGVYLSASWLALTFLSVPAALMTKPLLLWLALVTGALAGHALIHIVSGLCALPKHRRNTMASLLIGLSFVLGLVMGMSHIRYCLSLHDDAAAIAAHERERDAYEATDRMTAMWVEEHPESWEFLLLRANTLYEQNRIAEARTLDQHILAIMPDDLPDSLHARIVHRLGLEPGSP